MANKYPEHEKLEAVQDTSQTIYDLLEWLDMQGIILCKWHEGKITIRDLDPGERITEKPGSYFDILEKIEKEVCVEVQGYLPINESARKLLARYFNIDLNVLEAEKRSILEVLREEVPDAI